MTDIREIVDGDIGIMRTKLNKQAETIRELRTSIDDAYSIMMELLGALQRGDAQIMPGPSKRDWNYVAWFQRFGAWLAAQSVDEKGDKE